VFTYFPTHAGLHGTSVRWKDNLLGKREKAKSSCLQGKSEPERSGLSQPLGIMSEGVQGQGLRVFRDPPCSGKTSQGDEKGMAPVEAVKKRRVRNAGKVFHMHTCTHTHTHTHSNYCTTHRLWPQGGHQNESCSCRLLRP
jgi:hypothetical protein